MKIFLIHQNFPGLFPHLAAALAKPRRFMQLREAARTTIPERYDFETRCLPQMLAFVEGSRGAAP